MTVAVCARLRVSTTAEPVGVCHGRVVDGGLPRLVRGGKYDVQIEDESAVLTMMQGVSL